MQTQQRERDLPDDVVLEIASRSSLSTIASFRATAKRLNLLTYAPTFDPVHSPSGLLLQSMIKNNYVIKWVSTREGCSGLGWVEFDFLPLKVKLNACSDAQGLAYCESQAEQSRANGPGVKNHYVCKVTTREWQQIPNPKTMSQVRACSGIVVVGSDPVRYKIVRLSYARLSTQARFNYNMHACQVFDSARPGRWRRAEKAVELEREGEYIRPDSEMVTVNGNLHLLVGPKRVLVFDSVTERCDFFATPELEQGSLDLKLLKFQGKLGLMVENNISQETLTLWIMEDYENKQWARSYNMDRSAKLGRFRDSDTGLCMGFDAMFYEREASTALPVSISALQSDFEKVGWKTAADAGGYAQRQDAKERARRLNANRM
uniref:F-box associated beta-propeller type 3 domain-containing protein n=1 Tax=Kalanchoe fedtschenkoi TaxID=63787 RepID=A0A7N0UJ98_KALFE